MKWYINLKDKITSVVDCGYIWSTFDIVFLWHFLKRLLFDCNIEYFPLE